MLVVLIWPAPGTPLTVACGSHSRAQTDWLHAIAVIDGALVVGLALLVWARRQAAGPPRGVWRLPWETGLVAAAQAAMWATPKAQVLLVLGLPFPCGLLGVVLLIIAAVEIRRGQTGMLLAAIWVDVVCVVPAVFVIAALSDGYGPNICF